MNNLVIGGEAGSFEIGSTSSLQVGFDWVCFGGVRKVGDLRNSLL